MHQYTSPGKGQAGGEVEFRKQPYALSFELSKDSAVVLTSQPGVQIIAHLLEAKGPVSFLSWGYFNTCFQVKERPENYILEVVAREMIMENPTLMTILDSLKRENLSFAKNQMEILNWFYNQSKYADKSLNVYPVGKVYDESILKTILNYCE